MFTSISQIGPALFMLSFFIIIGAIVLYLFAKSYPAKVFCISCAAAGAVLFLCLGFLSPQKARGFNQKAEALQTITCLSNGLYALDDVWLVGKTKVAVVSPITIDYLDTTNRVISFTPLTNAWTLCDVTDSRLIAKKYQTINTPFSGIVEIKKVNGQTTISMYLPFRK